MLVLELGIDPGYVLDRMEIYELKALMDHRHLKNREGWEQARMMSFISARCSGAKIEEPRKLFSLPWDNEGKPELDKTPASEEDCQRLEATAQYLLENGLMD